jgi:hypothetical protein
MDDESDLVKVKHAYINLKMWLAKATGFVAIVYGVITFNAYFFFLGIAAVGLFWYWDRMIADEQARLIEADKAFDPMTKN